MSTKCVMRVVEEKYVVEKIERVLWSDKIDLLAVANEKGEVFLHRLNWQKVWHIETPVENVKVTAMCWTPDGRVLVISYNNRTVYIADIEKKTITSRMSFPYDVTYLNWCQEVAKDKRISPSFDDFKYMITDDDQIKTQQTDFWDISQHPYLDFLIVGFAPAEIQIFAFGKYRCGKLKFKRYLSNSTEDEVLSATFSSTLHTLAVAVRVRRESSAEVRLLLYDTAVLRRKAHHLHAIFARRTVVSNLFEHMDRVLNNMREMHEHMILEEMQMEIFQYARTKENGTLSAELLEILVFGVFSKELATFLVKDLTDKKLKKVSKSVEGCHVNIQKSLVMQMRPTVEHLMNELNTVMGMAAASEAMPESRVSVDPLTVHRALHLAGLFLARCNLTLEILENSLIKYKTFFRWLCSAACIVNDDKTDVSPFEFNQREMNFITNHLIDLEEPSPFMERDLLGSYLSEADLPPSDTDSGERGTQRNLWSEAIEMMPCLKESLFSTEHSEKSLVGLKNLFAQSVEEVFQCTKDFLTESIDISVKMLVQWVGIDTNTLSFDMMEHAEQEKLLVAFTKLHSNTENIVHVVELHLNCQHQNFYITRRASLMFNDERCGAYQPLSTQFYTPHALSVLLHRRVNGATYYVHLPTRSLPLDAGVDDPPPTNGFAYAGRGNIRLVDESAPWRMAVSGARKVAAFVVEEGRRVRVYEMEAEEEEESFCDMEISTPGPAPEESQLDVTLDLNACDFEHDEDMIDPMRLCLFDAQDLVHDIAGLSIESEAMLGKREWEYKFE